jgi:acyl carrier protein
MKMNAELATWLDLRSQALARVRRVLIEDLHVQRTPGQIDPDAPLFGTGLGLDSVDAVELVVSLETEFGFRLDDEQLARPAMRTVNSLVDLVLRRQQQHLAPGNTPVSIVAPPLDALQGFDAEVRAIRTTTALCTTPATHALRLSGPGAFATLDRVCAGPLNLQDTQLRLTLLLKPDGTVFADAYVGRDDERYFLLAEGPGVAALEAWLREHQTGGELTIERFEDTHRLVSLHGPWSWDLLAACLGPDVIGMPYLTFLRGEGGLVCFRTGKTGEFGYELLVPNEGFPTLEEGLVTQGKDWQLTRVSQAAIDHCSLENFFFDVRNPQLASLTPLELGLQWRLSTKKDFVGAAALKARAPRERVACIVSDEVLGVGAPLSLDGEVAGRVLASARSPVLGKVVSHALLSAELATPGVGGLKVGEHAARVVAPPVLNNRSLYVSPQRHTWAERESAQLPSLVLPG